MFPRDAMRKDDLALVKYQQSLSLADLREESLEGRKHPSRPISRSFAKCPSGGNYQNDVG